VDTKQKLIETAGPLFADKGREATSVRDVTDRAGVNVSAIHYYFHGIDGLYREAVRQGAQACVDRASFPDWPKDTPPARKLRDFINTYLLRVAVDCEPLWHSQLLMRELSHPTDFCSEFARDFVRPNLEILHGILHEMLPGASKRKLFLCGSSIVGQILHYRFARPVIRALTTDLEFEQLDIETLHEHIYEFSLAAVRSLARQRRKERS
jgi:AcrR family transcriptional regulator